jgi:hypothetical protein
MIAKYAIAALFLSACSAQETAKDAYSAQTHACLVAFTTSADQEACLVQVRARWNEAGAQPAAQLDGGVQ